MHAIQRAFQPEKVCIHRNALISVYIVVNNTLIFTYVCMYMYAHTAIGGHSYGTGFGFVPE